MLTMRFVLRVLTKSHDIAKVSPSSWCARPIFSNVYAMLTMRFVLRILTKSYHIAKASQVRRTRDLWIPMRNVEKQLVREWLANDIRFELAVCNTHAPRRARVTNFYDIGRFLRRSCLMKVQTQRWDFVWEGQQRIQCYCLTSTSCVFGWWNDWESP